MKISQRKRIYELFERDHEFINVMLNRTFIMQSVAAVKFHKMQVFDSFREKLVIDQIRLMCEELIYEESHIKTVLNIFKENMKIARLIQEACIAEWENETESDRQSELLLARKIISDEFLDDDSFFIVVRSRVTSFNEEMINSLWDVSTLDSFDKVVQLLLACYPQIDCEALNEAIDAISIEIVHLKSMDYLLSSPLHIKCS